jgi:Phage gp6-like head-tail connector protein
MYVTLEEAKRHLQIEEGYTGDDLYISSLIDASIIAVANHIKCTSLDETYPNGLPVPVKHAILLMAGNLFANREPVAFVQSYKVPLSYEYLLEPYVNYGK